MPEKPERNHGDESKTVNLSSLIRVQAKDARPAFNAVVHRLNPNARHVQQGAN